MIKLHAASRLLANWWDALDEDQKEEYIEEHPDSKYAMGYDGEDEDTPKHKPKPRSLKEGPKPPPKVLKTPKALLEGPNAVAPEDDDDSYFEDAEKPEETTKPKKKKWNADEERSLTKYLLHKGGDAAKKKAKELVKKGGHEMIRRLLDPLELTDIGKKGELPELPFKFKSKEGKIKDLQGKRAKLRKQMKGYGKNVPQKLKDQMKELSDKLEGLQED
jgi:hypothetical protein